MNRKRIADEVKFLISTVVAFFTQVPGSGRAAGMLMDALGRTFANNTEIPPKWITAALGRSRFLNYESRQLIEWYSKETAVCGTLPYVEICSSFQDAKNKLNSVELKLSSSEFHVSDWANENECALAHSGFKELVKDGHASSNKTIVKVSNFRFSRGKLVIECCPTKYLEQAKSNLILDYSEPNSIHSLRSILLAEFPGTLPPLEDTRLANTLGVASPVSCPEIKRDCRVQSKSVLALHFIFRG
jgi:hypothetical protein